jgi:hypothetical protein
MVLYVDAETFCISAVKAELERTLGGAVHVQRWQSSAEICGQAEFSLPKEKLLILQVCAPSLIRWVSDFLVRGV